MADPERGAGLGKGLGTLKGCRVLFWGQRGVQRPPGDGGEQSVLQDQRDPQWTEEMVIQFGMHGGQLLHGHCEWVSQVAPDRATEIFRGLGQ